MWACFFFQAEDGIRDGTVTGVQTCALPISGGCANAARARPARRISSAACSTRSSRRERAAARGTKPARLHDPEAELPDRQPDHLLTTDSRAGPDQLAPADIEALALIAESYHVRGGQPGLAYGIVIGG